MVRKTETETLTGTEITTPKRRGRPPGKKRGRKPGATIRGPGYAVQVGNVITTVSSKKEGLALINAVKTGAPLSLLEITRF